MSTARKEVLNCRSASLPQLVEVQLLSLRSTVPCRLGVSRTPISSRFPPLCPEEPQWCEPSLTERAFRVVIGCIV